MAEFTEKTDLLVLAKNLKKKVNGLLTVYGLLIVGTILLFLVVEAGVDSRELMRPRKGSSLRLSRKQSDYDDDQDHSGCNEEAPVNTA